jgi:hypothetical protein
MLYAGELVLRSTWNSAQNGPPGLVFMYLLASVRPFPSLALYIYQFFFSLIPLLPCFLALSFTSSLFIFKSFFLQ